ncbi:MAG: Eco57I restriction-modification methylase domain-containing protein, partial [Acidimicrobiales bacterium]
SHCVYGVDINPLALEVAKVALWLEALTPGKPLAFVDPHFKVGNALLGATPVLLRSGVPDAAFTVLEGDDKDRVKSLKARNKAERRHAEQVTAGQTTLEFEADPWTTEAASRQAVVLEALPLDTVADIRARADAWRKLDAAPELIEARRAADAWCAAFVQPADDDNPGITYDTVVHLADRAEHLAAELDLIDQLARQYQFFHWHLEFPGVFNVREPGTPDVDPHTGWAGGFACILGNPPWERVKIQDKEWFAAHGRDDIATAATKAKRDSMIVALDESDPATAAAHGHDKRHADGTAHLLLKSGRYPLTGQGDVNTYSVFAETFRTLVAPSGRAGFITPTGLATDVTTAPFFADTLSSRRLVAFYDFENEAKIFSNVDHRFRFATTVLAGQQGATGQTRFAFYTRHLRDVAARRFELTAAEVLQLNPNTGTLPVFRARRDADITTSIYRRHPVLIRDDDPKGNPWGLSFMAMFHMANDSGRFHDAKDVADAETDGWSCRRDGTTFVPLYEAKMLSHWDHRFSTYKGATQAQLNMNTLPRTTDAAHDDPSAETLPRYWVDQREVSKGLDGRWGRDWLLGWRDIARSSDSRTLVPSVFPASASGNKFPLAILANPALGCLLHATWSSLACDYIARQKLSGTGMTYFILKQIALPHPETFATAAGWKPAVSLAEWIRPYVLELSYTSHRLAAYAQDLGDDGPPFRWDPERRARLRAELDAAFMHIYGLSREETEHVLDSFFVVRKYEERDLGEFRTRRLVLDAYDRMAAATAREGWGWISLLDVPAGSGPRHPTW